jgi:subtilisin family serine protease
VKDDFAILANPSAVVTVVPSDDPAAGARQRTRDQVKLVTESDPALLVASETDDDADFNFIYDQHHVLLPPKDPDPKVDAAAQLRTYFGERVDDFRSAGRLGRDQPAPAWGRRYRLPLRRARSKDDLLQTVAELDRDFERGFITPEHYFHVAGKSTICPATEPAETGLTVPWPSNPTKSAGANINVVVVDTGFYRPAASLDWLDGVKGSPEPQPVKDGSGRIRPYAGHGTFVAGVVRSIAPACNVRVLSLHVDPRQPGGGVRELELVRRLDDALQYKPHLINLSAGARTRLNLPARSFELWWADVSKTHPDLVVVAAGGNDGSPHDFWPASFDWAVGVGSLDRNGQVSSFSNHGASVDAYALGRNIVNAFPKGKYVGHEHPIIGDERIFTQMLARWSGTSFATPIVTGLIAAEMSRQVPPYSAQAARAAVLARGIQTLGPVSNPVSILRQPYR